MRLERCGEGGGDDPETVMRWMAVSLAALLVPVSAAAVELSDPDELYDLSGIWLFHRGDNPAFAKPQLDDRDWEERILPTLESGWKDRWKGRAWYRRHINVESSALGQPYAVTIGPAREVVEIFVNGNLVARRGTFGSRPRGGARIVHLSGLVQAGVFTTGDNVIALRVYDPSWNGGLSTGPLRLGPPDRIHEMVDPSSRRVMGVRVSLGLLALCLGLAQILTVFGRRASRENWWLVGAGVSGAIMFFGGTGVLTGLVPNPSLAARLPVVGTCVAMVCLTSFFASRFDDWGARHVALGRAILWAVAAVLFLANEVAVFFASDAVLLMVALVSSLYAANQVSKAARRQERGAVAVFVSLLVMVLLLVYDGIWASPASVLPPTSAIGGLGVLLVTSVVGARTTMHEHERVLSEMLRLRRRADGRSWHSILDSTAMSITHPRGFLALVIHEAARELEVRRCSLVLEDEQGVLRVAAGMGLPTAAASQVIERTGSIAGWVFEKGEAVSSASLPDELAHHRRGAGYQSASFISYPVKQGGLVLGVLNVSDRNDGAEFSVSEEIATGEAADKLALVLTRLGQRNRTWFGNGPMPARSADGSSLDAALDEAEAAVVRATEARDTREARATEPMAPPIESAESIPDADWDDVISDHGWDILDEPAPAEAAPSEEGAGGEAAREEGGGGEATGEEGGGGEAGREDAAGGGEATGEEGAGGEATGEEGAGVAAAREEGGGGEVAREENANGGNDLVGPAAPYRDPEDH